MYDVSWMRPSPCFYIYMLCLLGNESMMKGERNNEILSFGFTKSSPLTDKSIYNDTPFKL